MIGRNGTLNQRTTGALMQHGPLRALQGDHLWHLLADDDMQQGHDEERDPGPPDCIIRHRLFPAV